MKWFCRNWYWVGGAVALLTLVFLAFAWHDLDVVRRLLILNFVALLIHQVEEYGWPGGEPAVMNIALRQSDLPDRYPLNQLSAMVVNCFIAYVVYVIPIFFPDRIWMGFAVMAFGLSQFFIHGIATNVRMHTFYNPGLGAVVLLHFPISITYIVYTWRHGLVTGMDFVWGTVLCFGIAIVFVALMTYVVLANRNSKWPFSPEEMERFHVAEKMASIKRPGR